jgi:hypothetical protein
MKSMNIEIKEDTQQLQQLNELIDKLSHENNEMKKIINRQNEQLENSANSELEKIMEIKKQIAEEFESLRIKNDDIDTKINTMGLKELELSKKESDIKELQAKLESESPSKKMELDRQLQEALKNEEELGGTGYDSPGSSQSQQPPTPYSTFSDSQGSQTASPFRTSLPGSPFRTSLPGSPFRTSLPSLPFPPLTKEQLEQQEKDRNLVRTRDKVAQAVARAAQGNGKLGGSRRLLHPKKNKTRKITLNKTRKERNRKQIQGLRKSRKRK